MDAATVVIPTKNRPDLLRLTLTSVLRQREVELRLGSSGVWRIPGMRDDDYQ
jgi:hypothetical protein